MLFHDLKEAGGNMPVKNSHIFKSTEAIIRCRVMRLIPSLRTSAQRVLVCAITSFFCIAIITAPSASAETAYLLSDIDKSPVRLSLNDSAVLGSSIYALGLDVEGNLYLYRTRQSDTQFMPIRRLRRAAEYDEKGNDARIRSLRDRLLISISTYDDSYKFEFESHFISDGTSETLIPIFPGKRARFEREFNGRFLFTTLEGAKEDKQSLVLFDPRTLTYEQLLEEVAYSDDIRLRKIAGSLCLFTSENEKAGTLELWVSGGALDSTKMIKSFPTSTTSGLEKFESIATKTFFQAGHEIWVTDGTAEGTSLLIDISKQDPLGRGPADYRSLRYEYAVSGGNLLFIAESEYYDNTEETVEAFLELWRSDGTVAGTQFVRSFQVDPSESSGGALLSPVRDRVLLSLKTYKSGRSFRAEVWSVDRSGNDPIKLLSATPSFMSETVSVGEDSTDSRLYFTISSESSSTLYVSGGLTRNTLALGTFDDTGYLRAVGSGLLFSAKKLESEKHPALWRSDGTALGTVRVFPDSEKAPLREPDDCIQIDAKLTCAEQDGRLWEITNNGRSVRPRGYTSLSGDQRTNSSSTSILASHKGKFLLDVSVPNYFGSYACGEEPESLVYLTNARPDAPFYDGKGPRTTTVGSNLYFVDTAFAPPSDPPSSTTFVGNFYRTDLTQQGTVSLGTFGIGGGEQPYTSIGKLGNRFLFAGEDSTGRGVFSTDSSVPEMLKFDLRAAYGQHIASLGSIALVEAYDASYNTTIWVTDGTPAGTRLSDVPHFNFDDYATMNGVAYYVTDYRDEANIERTGFWRTNGTGAGTRLLKDLGQPISSRVPNNSTALQSSVLFLSNDNTSLTLWGSNGSSGGTVPLKQWNKDLGQARILGVLSDKAYIAVQDLDTRSFELWMSDGTPGGTSRIRSWQYAFPQETNGRWYYLLGQIAEMNSTAYFSAWNAEAASYEIWKTNGTTEGTSRVLGTSPTGLQSIDGSLVSNGSTMIFSARDKLIGREVWALTAREIEDQCPSDHRKIEPGVCGCGQVELDINSDTVIDCGRDTPPPTPTPQGTPSIKDMEVKPPVLKQKKSSVIVTMQAVEGVTYKLTYTARPPKSARKKKIKAITITSLTPEKRLKSFKTGSTVTVTYKLVRGAEESKPSKTVRMKIRPVRRR